MCMITLDEADGKILRGGRGPRLERSNGLSEVVGRGWRLEGRGGGAKARGLLHGLCVYSTCVGLTNYM